MVHNVSKESFVPDGKVGLSHRAPDTFYPASANAITLTACLIATSNAATAPEPNRQCALEIKKADAVKWVSRTCKNKKPPCILAPEMMQIKSRSVFVNVRVSSCVTKS